jgi:hypothetical protein
MSSFNKDVISYLSSPEGARAFLFQESQLPTCDEYRISTSTPTDKTGLFDVIVRVQVDKIDKDATTTPPEQEDLDDDMTIDLAKSPGITIKTAFFERFPRDAVFSTGGNILRKEQVFGWRHRDMVFVPSFRYVSDSKMLDMTIDDDGARLGDSFGMLKNNKVQTVGGKRFSQAVFTVLTTDALAGRAVVVFPESTFISGDPVKVTTTKKRARSDKAWIPHETFTLLITSTEKKISGAEMVKRLLKHTDVAAQDADKTVFMVLGLPCAFADLRDEFDLFQEDICPIILKPEMLAVWKSGRQESLFCARKRAKTEK